ncbi:MAG: hypothetical protein N2C12_01480 [Planctomycetales bacterium]
MAMQPGTSGAEDLLAPALPTTQAFDPYADPTLTQPQFDPNPGSPTDPGLQPLFTETTFGQWPRFLQQLRFRETWLARNGAKGVGWTTSELSGTFMVPIFFLPQNAPLMISPGFALHFTDGPVSSTGADLPARLYDGYVDVGWTPQVTRTMSADIGIRGGLYTDFGHVVADSFRLEGRGIAVLKTSDTMQWRAGVIYINRVGIKLLPTGGLVWTPGGPNGNVRFDILFPNPKFSFRVFSLRSTDIWWYLAGEYGGGSWTIQRGGVVPGAPANDRFAYNDIRIISGLEWTGYYGLRGFAEAGWVLAREIDYVSNAFDTKPPQTVMVRGGITY